jgi:hypothetical protein
MKNDTIDKFKNLLRFSGVFNILFAFPLIFPVLYTHYLNLLQYFNTILGLGGKAITIPTNPVHALLINTAGIDLVLIGAIVLVVSRKPWNNRKIIFLNAVGRLLFASIIAYYVIFTDLIRIVILFGAIDVMISIGFLYYLSKIRGISRLEPS